MIHILQEYQSENNPTRLQTGDIITHSKYGYRGVIVHIDPTFQGNENWYLSNQTKPNKKQPWYFVLVDGNQQVTYVAESNLSLDQCEKHVDHPMINLFFSGYDDELKKYIRNEVPWNPSNPPETPPPSPPPNFPPPGKPPNFTPREPPSSL